MSNLTIPQKLLVNLKREYWEYRRLVWGIPIMMSILFILAAVMAIVFSRFAAEHTAMDKVKDEVSISVAMDENSPLEQLDSIAQIVGEKPHLKTDSNSVEKGGEEDDAEFNFVGLYMFVAWLAAFYYLLSSLYVDRRDKSILYWKSLPVSELENVASKFLFGVIGFALAAIIVAWVTALILFTIVHGMASAEQLAEMQKDSKFVFNATHLFVWPVLGLVFGLLWGAPVFAYILMVSAVSKRLPFVLLVLPPFVLLILEGIFFRSRYLVGFMADHTPAKALMMISQSPNATATFFVDNTASLILGLILAAGFLTIAVWYRNHKFEI